jgi:hypothetical protein
MTSTMFDLYFFYDCWNIYTDIKIIPFFQKLEVKSVDFYVYW